MVGHTIKTYLENKGIKQSYLARRLGMPASTLHAKLNGGIELKADELFKISAILEVPLETFRPKDEADPVALKKGGASSAQDSERLY